MVTSTAYSQNSQTFEDRAKKTALNRWKLETLTGLLGLRSLQSHQSQSEKNAAAENAHVRKSVWGSCESEDDEEPMAGHTILGDVTNPTPIVINQQPQQSSGTLGKVIAGVALVAALMGIPAAGIIGYGVSQWAAEKTAAKPVETEDTSLDIGLGRFEDLLPE